MRSPLRRLPTRSRTALASGLAALLLAGGGALWLRQHVYDSRLAAGQEQALYQARAIARDNKLDGGTLTVHADTVALPYAVIGPDGILVVQGEPLRDQAFAAGQLPPVPPGAPESWHRTRAVTLQQRPPAQANRLSGRTFAAVGVHSVVSHPSGRPQPGAWPTGTYTVYVLVTPFEAEDTVKALDPALYAGAPGAALVVAGFAWGATGRALRPIDEIRAELAEISERRLDRRVPVPHATDEISRMAQTTNDTLDRLERSAEQQRQFVADAAHELRSPIAGLRASLDVSLAHPDRTDWPRATAEALESVRRLQLLTNDLLFLAATAQDRHDAVGTQVDLADLAQDLLTEVRHTRPGTVRFVLDAAAPAVVTGDARQLRRLLRNLLDNAARHARTTVTVTIAPHGRHDQGQASFRDGAVRVEVHDDGRGIAAADRERVFERFTRLDEARSRDAGGSGLGLAIARGIAIRHHGTLTLADAPPGHGATLVVTMPSSLRAGSSDAVGRGGPNVVGTAGPGGGPARCPSLR